MTDQKKRILVVDDEPDILEYLREVLCRDGYVVEAHNHPASALEKLLAVEFDLVVSDIRMPGMSGLDMIRLARTQGKAIKNLIFLSGNAVDDQLVKDVQDIGAVLLSKPLTAQELREAVAQVIGNTVTTSTTTESQAEPSEPHTPPPDLNKV